MPMNKPHLEFHKVDMNSGWATPPGYPPGIKQKILASDLDETRKMGGRTRLLKFDPGVYTTAPFVHDHWEEVYLLQGDLIVGNDAQGKGGACALPVVASRDRWLFCRGQLWPALRDHQRIDRNISHFEMSIQF